MNINKKRILGLGLAITLTGSIIIGTHTYTKNIEREQAKIEYKHNFDEKFDSIIENCYSRYGEVEGVTTVEVIDILTEIDYLVEANAEKRIILYQFGELFRLIGEKNLIQYDAFELYTYIVNNY